MSYSGLKVAAAFETFDATDFPLIGRKDERGVLMSCWTPANRRARARSPEPPDFAMGFLKTDLDWRHSTLLDTYPNPLFARNRQPVARIAIGGSGFRVAARYELEIACLHLNVMLGPSMDVKENVQNIKGYGIARLQFAVACAQAILGQTAEYEEMPVELLIQNNFENLFLKKTEPRMTLNNLEHLNQHLQS